MKIEIDGEQIEFGNFNGDPNVNGGQNTNIVRFFVKFREQYFAPYYDNARIGGTEMKELLDKCKTKHDVESLMNTLKS